jgi:multidrug resistance efflux pump
MKTVARVLLTLVLVTAGCVAGYELWDYYLFSPWTRDARVQADVVDIAPDVSGFVDDLRVKDNQFVHKGDVLLDLDRERSVYAGPGHGRGECRGPQGRDGNAPARGRAAR